MGPPLFIPDEHLRWLGPSPPHLLLHIKVPHQVTGVTEDVMPILKDLASPSDTRSCHAEMDVYVVGEDGGTFRLPGVDVLSGDWLSEVETFSVMYPEGDCNVRCLNDTRFLRNDILGHKVCILISSLRFISIIFVNDCDVLHQPEVQGGELLGDDWCYKDARLNSSHL